MRRVCEARRLCAVADERPRRPESSPEFAVKNEAMSIALEIGAGIGSAGFIRGIGCVPNYESPEIEEDSHLLPDSPSPSSSSSSSSSIGKDSDAVASELEDDERAGMGEVQSAYKGLLQGMESIEESLPIRCYISILFFYFDVFICFLGSLDDFS